MMSKLDEYLQKYIDEFEDGFPMIPLAWGRSDDEIVEIIKRCLKEKKDVYQLKILEEDPEVDF